MKMTNLKNTVAAITLTAVIAFGSTFAHAGIIVAGFNEKTTTETTCVETKTEKMDWGIIVAGLRGIIVAGFTGIIVAGAAETTPNVDCGIIVAG